MRLLLFLIKEHPTEFALALAAGTLVAVFISTAVMDPFNP